MIAIASIWLAAATAQTVAPAPMPAPPACTAPAPLPPELAGWAIMKPLRAASEVKGIAAATLPIGSGVRAALLPTPKVAYPVRPEKPGGSVSSGGLFGFEVVRAGRYRVALDSGAWVDVVAGGTPAVSVAHGHGPACSGVRKMVDFDLAPGRYLLQIAGNGSPTIGLMVARLPS